MSGRFFMRFNLHSSVGHFPVNADIFERLISCDRACLQKDLDDFEKIQCERVSGLCQKYPREIEVLKNKRVLFIGDSITSDNIGYRVSVTRAADLTAYDASISGGISSMMLYDAKAIIEKHRPDIVSVMIGTNDSACVDTAPTVSIDEYVRNVKSIIGWGKQNGAEILLFAVPPISETRFNIPLKTQTNDNIGRYNEALQGVANDNDIRLISNEWVNKSEDMLEPDGVHLSVEGQKIFSEKWIVAAAQIFNERLMKG